MGNFQTETIAELNKVTAGTVAHRASERGRIAGEPLLLCLDGLLRYAKGYEKRFGDKLASDYVLGPAWRNALDGLRVLLNGDGAVAYERGYTTDSKDNGALEAIYWHAMTAAGMTEDDGINQESDS